LLGRADFDLDNDEESGIVDLDVHAAGAVPIGAFFNGDSAVRRRIDRKPIVQLGSNSFKYIPEKSVAACVVAHWIQEPPQH
jgi:hypothetical protein